MATPHINAELGDFSNVVLLAGDPRRAKWIADTYLTDVKEVTNVRSMTGFTGYTKNGYRISVMGSGMGMPSIGIYSYELYSAYNVDTIIRIGTCGAYQDNINHFDIVMGVSASTDSNWVYQYGLPQFSPCADFDLMLAVDAVAKAKGKTIHAGNILSADVFYDDDPEYWKRWAKLNVLAVEMESYALYSNAAKFKKRALCLLTVTDHFIHKGITVTAEQRQLGLGEMVEVALEAAEKFSKERK